MFWIHFTTLTHLMLFLFKSNKKIQIQVRFNHLEDTIFQHLLKTFTWQPALCLDKSVSLPGPETNSLSKGETGVQSLSY